MAGTPVNTREGLKLLGVPPARCDAEGERHHPDGFAASRMLERVCAVEFSVRSAMDRLPRSTHGVRPRSPNKRPNLRDSNTLPAEFGRPVSNGYTSSPSQESMLQDYLRILSKRKWIIAVSAVLIVSVVGLSTLRATPVYVAVGSIAINKVDPMMFSLKDSTIWSTCSTPGNSALWITASAGSRCRRCGRCECSYIRFGRPPGWGRAAHTGSGT